MGQKRLVLSMTARTSKAGADTLISVPGKHLILFANLKDSDNKWEQAGVSSPGRSCFYGPGKKGICPVMPFSRCSPRSLQHHSSFLSEVSFKMCETASE